jgi:hypothetical protein
VDNRSAIEVNREKADVLIKSGRMQHVEWLIARAKDDG